MIAFDAHFDYASRSTWTANIYNPITWPATEYNEGNRFDGRYFTPVIGEEPSKIVIFSGQIWLQSGAASGNFVAKLFKNAGGIRAPIFCRGIVYGQDGPIILSAQDKANPGDKYDWQLYTTNPSVVMDGNPAHTFFSACVIP